MFHITAGIREAAYTLALAGVIVWLVSRLLRRDRPGPRAGAPGEPGRKRLHAVLTAAVLLAVPLVCLASPRAAAYLVREGGPVEIATAALFLSVFVLGVTCRAGVRRHRPANALLAAAGLLGCLDELSFGERIFNFTMPVIGGVKIDGAHDFLELAYVSVRDAGPGVSWPLLAGAALLAFLALLGARRHLGTLFSLARRHPATWYLLLATGFAVPAVVIDSAFSDAAVLPLLEEVFEMAVALSLLFAWFAVHASGREDAVPCSSDGTARSPHDSRREARGWRRSA